MFKSSMFYECGTIIPELMNPEPMNHELTKLNVQCSLVHVT